MTLIQKGTRLSRAIDGSSRAVIEGWLWGAMPFLLGYIIGYPIALVCMIPHIFLTWLLVCLPVYYLEEYKHLFHNRRRCMWYGAIGGPLMLLYLPFALYLCIPNVHELPLDKNLLTAVGMFSVYGIPSAIITGIVACGEACKNRVEFMPEDCLRRVTEGD
jgi:hypothetical protein